MVDTRPEDEVLVRRLLQDHEATAGPAAFDPKGALAGGRRRRRRRAAAGTIVALASTGAVIVLGAAVLTPDVVSSTASGLQPSAQTPSSPAVSISAPSDDEPAAVSPRSSTVVYQDGRTVQWRGPARGEAWTADVHLEAEVATERAKAWEQAVRELLPMSGWSEELGLVVGDDGEVVYSRFAGVFASAWWAQGPDVGWADIDPCSDWPETAQLSDLEEGVSCRVLFLDGHPVVASEGLSGAAVFTVRPDGVAVMLGHWAVDPEGTPVATEELARAALDMPAP